MPVRTIALLVGCDGHARDLNAAAAAGPEHPNVIFFLMDDLGWNDLGYTGSKFYESPNIDRLAARGVVFTRAYAAPICSPSRASILTGLDPARTGFTLAAAAAIRWRCSRPTCSLGSILRKNSKTTGASCPAA